jgi:hypothetical protein
LNSRPSAWPSRLIALASYAGLVAFLTWPLLPNAATHLPNTAPACGFDSLYSGWALAHETRTLLTNPTRLAEGNHFHPAADTLFYGPTALGALPYFAPTFLITGNPTLALNVTFLLSIVLTAWTLHLVVHRWTASHAAGAVAACSYLLTGWVLWEWLPTTPHWAVLQYLPLIILLSASPATALARNLMLLGLVVLQCLTDVTYVAPAVLAPLGVLAVARLARRRTRSAGAALLGIVAVAAIVVSVVAAGHLRVRAGNPNIERQTYWRSDPDFFRQYGTPLPWGLVYRNAPTALPAAALWLIGAGAVGFGLRRAPRRQAWGAAALWTLLGAYLSLTPSVRWGDHAVDLPQAWLAEWVPIYRAIRVPSRLGVTALLGLSLLAGLAFAECAERVARVRPLRSAAPFLNAALALTVLAVMFFQYRARLPAALGGGTLGPPYAIAPAVGPDGPFLSLLRQTGGPLLEFPAQLTPPERAPVWHARAMYRSIFHGRKILNGYASYFPAGFIERMVLATRLPDPTALAQLRRETGLELFWVHTDSLSAGARARWTDLFERGGRDDLRPVAREGNQLLFQVLGSE